MSSVCTQQHGRGCLLNQLLPKAFQTEFGKKKMQSVLFLLLLDCLQVLETLLHLQHLQIQFVLTNQFGFEKNFQDLISDGKGAGSSFFSDAGPDLLSEHQFSTQECQG